MQLIEYKY